MILAYNKGAKYIVVFDSNPTFTQGILDPQHLNAIKLFSQYMKSNPTTDGSTTPNTAYVLPQDYACGFGGSNDKIWGLWGPDNLTIPITTQLYCLMQQYGNNLNMVYADESINYTSQYSELIFWNGTTYTK